MSTINSTNDKNHKISLLEGRFRCQSTSQRISNAIIAVEKTNNKQIIINAFLDENQRSLIQVIDSGIGIPIDIQDKIFIPFFNDFTFTNFKIIYFIHTWNKMIQIQILNKKLNILLTIKNNIQMVHS